MAASSRGVGVGGGGDGVEASGGGACGGGGWANAMHATLPKLTSATTKAVVVVVLLRVLCIVTPLLDVLGSGCVVSVVDILGWTLDASVSQSLLRHLLRLIVADNERLADDS